MLVTVVVMKIVTVMMTVIVFLTILTTVGILVEITDGGDDIDEWCW